MPIAEQLIIGSKMPLFELVITVSVMGAAFSLDHASCFDVPKSCQERHKGPTNVVNKDGRTCEQHTESFSRED